MRLLCLFGLTLTVMMVMTLRERLQTSPCRWVWLAPIMLALFGVGSLLAMLLWLRDQISRDRLKTAEPDRPR